MIRRIIRWIHRKPKSYKYEPLAKVVESARAACAGIPPAPVSWRGEREYPLTPGEAAALRRGVMVSVHGQAAMVVAADAKGRAAIVEFIDASRLTVPLDAIYAVR